MNSSVLNEALSELLPSHHVVLNLRYSRSFKGFNGNAYQRGNHITVSLSAQWKTVSPDIQKGIVQELLVRLLKIPQKTVAMDLYHSFLKNVHHVVPKTQTHPLLETSFERVNQQFFLGLLEKSNFVVGQSLRKLGSYDYGTDTIMISEILLKETELLDYVMYHEMLHKKHKFSEGRHHTKEFRYDEKKFGNLLELEKRLGTLIRKSRARNTFVGRFFRPH